MFVSGKPQVCRASTFEFTPDGPGGAQATMRICAGQLRDVWESWDEQERIFVGEQACQACGQSWLYSRRATAEDGAEHMPKKVVKKKPGKKAPAAKKKAAPRATAARLVKANRKTKPAAARSRGPLADAPIDLGPVVLPEPDDAVKVIGKLAELNDRVLAASKAYQGAKETAKQRKEKWDELAEELSSMLRLATHGSDRPLLEIAEREGDQERMEDAGKRGGASPGEAIA